MEGMLNGLRQLNGIKYSVYKLTPSAKLHEQTVEVV